MHIFEFINLIQNSFSSQINRDPKTGKISAKYIYQDVITWFTDDSLIDNVHLNQATMKSLNYCERILNESNDTDMPITDAKLLKSKITADNFRDVYEAADLTDEAEQLLIDAFGTKGYKLDGIDIPQELADVFAHLLQERSEINKQSSMRNATFISDSEVKVGGRVYKLPPALYVPTLPTDKENEYVSALLSVYSQKTSNSITSISDLEDFFEYQTEIQIHREAFYSAESVLHKVRKFFYDAESEFNTLKNEMFDSIRLFTNRRITDAYDKLSKTMDMVVVLTLSKSYFSTPGNTIVGNGEKIGIVHMLVNDGKVRWL